MTKSNWQKRVSFKVLRRVLESFDYLCKAVPNEPIVFYHPRHPLLIVISALREDATVRPIDLLSIRNTLINDGVIHDEEQFESLFRIKKGDQLVWTDPRSKIRTVVTAASGESSDGQVLVKQKGVLSQCPINQLALLEDVEEKEAAGGR